MPANALKVEDRRFDKFSAESSGSAITVTGEYVVTVSNTGVLPVPGGRYSLASMTVGDVVIAEKKDVSLGRIRTDVEASVSIDVTITSPSTDAESKIQSLCNGNVSEFTIEERVSGVLLAAVFNDEFEVSSSSPNCNLSGGQQPPITPPEPPIGDPPQEPPDDGGDGSGNDDPFSTPDQPAQIEVSSVDVPNSVTAGDQITVDALIENTGDQSGSDTITFSVNGQERDSTDVNLNAGETTNISFNYNTSQNDAPAVNVFVASPFNSEENTVDVEINAVDMEIEGATDPLEDLDNTYRVDDEPDNASQYVWDIFNTDAETGGAPRDETRTTTDDELTVTFDNPGEFEIEVEAQNNGGAVIGVGSIEGVVLDQFGTGDDPTDDTPQSGARSMSEAVEDVQDNIDKGF